MASRHRADPAEGRLGKILARVTLTGMPAWGQWAILLVLGGGLGRLLVQADIPAGQLLGPIVIATLCGLRGAAVRVHRVFLVLAQAVAGYLIALNMDVGILHQMTEQWFVVLIFVALTFAATCIIGLIAARWTGIDRDVAIWGFLPGMAGTVIAMSEEQGLDSRMVAFIQILRLFVVIASMSLVATFLVAQSAPLLTSTSAFTLPSVGLGLLVMASGLAAAYGLRALPGGATLVPLGLTVMLRIWGFEVHLPAPLAMGAFLALGLQIGLRMTPQLLRQGAKALPALLAASLLLIAFCAVSGLVLSWVADVDLMSAMLATVPGSIETIAMIAISAHADVAFVMTLQTVRMFAVALLGPMVACFLMRLLSQRAKRQGPA